MSDFSWGFITGAAIMWIFNMPFWSKLWACINRKLDEWAD